ncbi:MAG: glycerate kinase [Clostridia bacterium]|nr:glycerate kinase [Clostridia bacterium]
MKILVATDSFKETLTSLEIGEIIRDTLVDHEVSIVPLSDGGEGLLEAIGGKDNLVHCETVDGLFRKIKGCYHLRGEIAIIEAAVSNGIGLLCDEEKNPMNTSTYGLGLLIKDAVEKGARKILVGIGGSCTNDGGIGMLEALGVEFYHQDERLHRLTGKDLEQIDHIHIGTFKAIYGNVDIEVACDVDNPLLGEEGATWVYGPQKGGTEKVLISLEKAMSHYSQLVRKILNKDWSTYPGAGAAGGLGFAFLSFFEGNLKKGIELVLDYNQFNEQLKSCDLVITGEGKIDHQSLRGKVIQGVLKRAQDFGIPVIAIAGQSETSVGFRKSFSVVPAYCSLEESMKNPKDCLIKMLKQGLVKWMKEEVIDDTIRT